MNKVRDMIDNHMALTVKDLMTTDVISLKEGDNLNLSRFLMETKRVRHVPIVNSNKEVVGLITQRDLFAMSISTLADLDKEQQLEILRGIPVKEVMRSNIQTVVPEMELEEAAELMLQNKFGCLPVVSDKKLVGIITESDFVKLTANLLRYARERAESESQ